MKKFLLTIFFLVWTASALAATSRTLPAAAVYHTIGDVTRAFQSTEVSAWVSQTAGSLNAITTTDQDSSGNTLYVTSTAPFEGCEANTSKVVCGGQTLTITAVNSGVSLSVSSITGTINSGTAVACSFILMGPDDLVLADYNVTISGATNTTAFEYCRGIIAAPGNRGTETTGMRFEKSYAGNVYIFSVAEDNFFIYDIGVKAVSTGVNTSGVGIRGNFNNLYVAGCTIYDCTGTGTSFANGILYYGAASDVTGYFYNNLIKDTSGGSNANKAGIRIINTVAGTVTAEIYNCTIVGSGFSDVRVSATSGTTAIANVKNTIAVAMTDANSGGTDTINQTTNVLNAAVDYEADGYHLDQPDTLAAGQGTDLSATFTDDIDGETRVLKIGNKWDIGCDAMTESVITINETTNSMKDGRVIARDSNDQGELEFTGTYNFPATDEIEIQAIRRDTSAVVPLSGGNWKSLSSVTLNSGTYTGRLTNIPSGDYWYQFVARDKDDPGYESATSNDISVGIVVIAAGQSWMEYWFNYMPYSGSLDETPSDLTRKFTTTSWVTMTGDGGPVFANMLHTAIGCVVGVINAGHASTALYEAYDIGEGYWIGASDATYNMYEKLQAALAISEPISRIKANYTLWYQGHNEAIGSISQTDYYNGLIDLYGDLQSDTNNANLSIFVVGLPDADQQTDAGAANVRLAQLQFVNESESDYKYYSHSTYDLELYNENVAGTYYHWHMTEASQEIEAVRAAQSIAYHEVGTGDYTYWRGPRAEGYTIVDAEHTDTHIALNSAATDYTPATGITGFEVYNGSSWIAATGARQDATTVRLTHASATVSDARLFYGGLLDVTGVIQDNSALTLPIEPFGELDVYTGPSGWTPQVIIY